MLTSTAAVFWAPHKLHNLSCVSKFNLRCCSVMTGVGVVINKLH